MLLPSIKYDFTILRRVIMTLILLKSIHTLLLKNQKDKYIFLNNKSLNQKTRLPSYGCYQCFAPISFVVDMLDDIS